MALESRLRKGACDSIFAHDDLGNLGFVRRTRFEQDGPAANGDEELIAKPLLEVGIQLLHPRMIERIQSAGIDHKVLRLRVVDRNRLGEKKGSPNIGTDPDMLTVRIREEYRGAGARSPSGQNRLLPRPITAREKEPEMHRTHGAQIGLSMTPAEDSRHRGQHRYRHTALALPKPRRRAPKRSGRRARGPREQRAPMPPHQPSRDPDHQCDPRRRRDAEHGPPAGEAPRPRPELGDDVRRFALKRPFIQGRLPPRDGFVRRKREDFRLNRTHLADGPWVCGLA